MKPDVESQMGFGVGFSFFLVFFCLLEAGLSQEKNISSAESSLFPNGLHEPFVFHREAGNEN